MNKKLRSGLIFALKLAVTAYILWRIFSRIEFAEVWQRLISLPWWLFGVLLLLSAIRHWGQFQNWSHSLRLNPSYRPERKQELVSYLVGNPLRFVIPGGSGSIGKIMFVSNSSRWASLFSFGAERAFMTWATWTYAFAAALFFYTGIPLWIRILLLSACALAPVWAYWLLDLGRCGKAVKPQYTSLVPQMALIQLGISALSYLQYWLILLQIRPIGFWQSWMRMALTQFSNSIPITVAGLGLRESFAIHFLSDVGFSASQAVSATLTLFLIQDLLPALIGIPFLFRSKRRSR